jgi:hypothetical protein
MNQNPAPETPWAAPGIGAEIPQDLRSKAEELERKARFFAKQKRRPEKEIAPGRCLRVLFFCVIWGNENPYHLLFF